MADLLSKEQYAAIAADLQLRTKAFIDGEFRDVDDRAIDNQPPARKFADYMIAIDREGLPDGVEIIERIS